MTETGILSNQREAMRLFQRGVAAARGGQKRVAAGLLQRAVQLDPRHELAWLWLSGVLDDPQEAAFCLRSVLALNPANERAQAGLKWLEQRRAAGAQGGQSAQNGHAAGNGNGQNGHAAGNGNGQNGHAAGNGNGQNGHAVAAGALAAQASGTTTTLKLPIVSADESEAARDARQQGESWWVNWRRSRRAMNRARTVLWLVPILLLTLTLAWRYSVEQTVASVQATLRPTALPTLVPTPLAAEAGPPTPEPLRPGRPRASDDAAVLSYLSEIEPLREQLRQAVEDYRQAIKRPGGSSIQHSAAARQLRSKVENAQATMQAMQPPAPVAPLHAEYLAGLSTELEALDALLSFYGEYNVGMANRAALRFQESSIHFNRAQAGFDQILGQIAQLSTGLPQQMPR